MNRPMPPSLTMIDSEIININYNHGILSPSHAHAASSTTDPDQLGIPALLRRLLGRYPQTPGPHRRCVYTPRPPPGSGRSAPNNSAPDDRPDQLHPARQHLRTLGHLLLGSQLSQSPLVHGPALSPPTPNSTPQSPSVLLPLSNPTTPTPASITPSLDPYSSYGYLHARLRAHRRKLCG